MLKKYSIVLFIVLSINSFAQTITHPISNFTELKVFNALQVNLIKSTEQKLEIIGENAEDIIIKQSGGSLKIYKNIKSIFDSKSLTINLYYNDNIGELDANQGAIIYSKEIIKQTQIDVSAQEGAYIKIKAEVDFIKIKAVTGGNIQLIGTTTSQQIDLTTGSNYDGFDFIAKQTSITSSSGSEAKINVSDVLDATVKFGGTILYKGSPKSVKTAKVVGGTINPQL